MKKIITWIVAIILIILITICTVALFTISRKDAIALLEKNQLKDSTNVKVIETESGSSYENYTRETSKLDNVEYCKIKMAGEEECNYINWVNVAENKDIVVFINEKIYNSSTLEVEPILVNYSEKAVQYFKDETYKYEYVSKEKVNDIECIAVRAYKANEEDKNYEEMKVWVNKETGDCVKLEYYLNESDFSRPESPTSILEFTYSYDSVKIEEIKEPKEEDYPDFKYTYLY